MAAGGIDPDMAAVMAAAKRGPPKGLNSRTQVTMDFRQGIPAMAIHGYKDGRPMPPFQPKPPPASWPVVGHVRVHPKHKKKLDGSEHKFLHELPPQVLTENPETFRPDMRDFRDAGSGIQLPVSRWGLRRPLAYSYGDPAAPEITWTHVPGFDNASILDELRKSGKTSKVVNGEMDEFYHPYQTPTRQFLSVLERRKRAELETAAVKAAMTKLLRVYATVIWPVIQYPNAPKSAYTGKRSMYRCFVVPGSITLAKLHDQVLCPIWGWARGYHAYCFEDIRDGSVFGPAKYAGNVDMIHVGKHYHHMADDRDVPLALLLRNKGDMCMYTYDLGECWQMQLDVDHEVTVTDMPKDPVESVGLVGGSLGFPPEDMARLRETIGGHGGPSTYGVFLDKYERNSAKCKKDIEGVETMALNYITPWPQPDTPKRFQPLEFDHEFHKRYLALALAGPQVVKKGQFAAHNVREKTRACETCGDKLSPLRACGGCKQVFYCSTECQKADWKRHKPECLKVKGKAT